MVLKVARAAGRARAARSRGPLRTATVVAAAPDSSLGAWVVRRAARGVNVADKALAAAAAAAEEKEDEGNGGGALAAARVMSAPRAVEAATRCALDAGVLAGLNWLGGAVATAPPDALIVSDATVLAQAVIVAAGINYGINVLNALAELGIAAGAVAYAAADPEAFVNELEALAAAPAKSDEGEEDEEIEVVDVERSRRVIDALFALQRRLTEAPAAPASASERVAALLALQANSEDFDAAAFDLTAEEAQLVAAAFAKHDRNETGRLEAREWDSLVEVELRQEDRSLSAAMLALLDQDGDRTISLRDFAALWRLSTPVEL